ncbi:hypothetical protein LG331_09810 [Vreelandella aquamarina]|uniref:hypothetical protein n=1 Tax=Vreelandella aquamarina TaxID=77097 RepID=UPI00384C8521
MTASTIQWAYQKIEGTDGVNERCLISDCKQYKISKFTLSGESLFLIYHCGKEIGDATNGKEARRIAEQHKAKGAA